MSDRERGGDSGSAQPADAVGTPAPASIPGKRTLLDPPDPTEPKKVGQQSLVTATFGHGAHAAAPVARAKPTAPAIPELPPAAPAPGAPVMQLRSTDPRVNGRTAADVSHQLKLDLLDLAQHANRMVDGMAMEEQSLAHDRTSDPVGTWLDATAGPHADTPTTFEPVMWELLAFAGHAVAHTRAPEDAANLRALAADVVTDHDRFRALASRSSALWDALEDDAKTKMHALGHMLTTVNAIKEADFAAAVIVAGMVAAPLAAGGTASVGGFGAGALGGGLVGAGLHAADLTDDKHSTAARTWSGFVEGALMAPTAALGGAAGKAARAGLARIGTQAAKSFVGAAVEGAANGAVMSDSYETATSIAGGNDVGTAMKAGLRGAAIGAPFGALMGGLIGERLAGREGEPEPTDVPAPPSTDIDQVPRDHVATDLAEHEANGATVRADGRDAATGRRAYDVTYPDGRRVRVVEGEPTARPGAGATAAPPTEAEAAAARAEADRAAEVQARRDDQLTALVRAHDGPVVADTVIMGAGQAGTLAYATGGGAVGAVPGVEVIEIPPTFNVAPEGSMFARHGDFPIGQRPGELRAHPDVRSAGELTANHDAPVEASNYNRSLTMTGYDSGMTTYKATVTQVEVRPAEGWGDGMPPDAQGKPIRITAGGKTIYVDRFISAGGLGKPRPMGERGTALAAHEPELAAAGKLVYAQETLALSGAKTIVVVGDGATGAWACEAAIKQGASNVHWIGRPPPAPPAIPSELRLSLGEVGLTDGHIDVFWRGYNERNAATFTHIGRETGARIDLHVGLQDMQLDPTTGRVKVVLADGSIVLADGVVSATGQMLDVPKGMDLASVMEFRPVVVDGRLVALDAFGPAGRQLPIRVEGAQMSKAAPIVRKQDRELVLQMLSDQSNDAAVPQSSRGVPGSIHQTNIDIPLASQAPMNGGAR